MALPLKWELPGGKLESGESEEECIQREIREELGLEIFISKRLIPNTHQLNINTTIHLIPFLCNRFIGKLHLKEHRQVAWLDFDRILELDWAEADIPIIQNFINEFQ